MDMLDLGYTFLTICILALQKTMVVAKDKSLSIFKVDMSYTKVGESKVKHYNSKNCGLISKIYIYLQQYNPWIVLS